MVSIKFKILFTRKDSTVTIGFFVYWYYAANPYFRFLCNLLSEIFESTRTFSMFLLLLLVLLIFISNLLLGGITILSESLITDSAQGPNTFQCFGKYVLIKLYEGTTINSPQLFMFKQVKEEHITHANFSWILTPWAHTYTNFTHAKKSSGDIGIFAFIRKWTC